LPINLTSDRNFDVKTNSCFRSFDKEKSGKISEKCFRTIMVNKDDVQEKDIEEMLEEYYR